MQLLALIAAAILTATAATRPPSPDEQRLFDEGVRALQSGDAAGAEKAWQSGYALGRDPAFLVRIAEAQEKAGRTAEAADTYRRYLKFAPDAADRADIEQRLARLTAGLPAATPPAAAPAPDETPGELGAAPARTLPPPPPRAAPSRDDELPTGPARPADESGWRRYELAGAIATGAAVTLLATAGLFAASAASDEDDVKRLVRYRDMNGAPTVYSAVADQYERAMADGERNDRYAKYALIGTGIAAAAAVTFFILDAKLGREPAIAVVPTLGPPGAGLAGAGLAAVGTVRF